MVGATASAQRHRRHRCARAGNLHGHALHQRRRVDNQRDLAIAQHRGSGNTGYAGKLRADILDHDFLIAQNLIHLHRDALAAAPEQQRHDVAMRLRHLLQVAQEPRQIEQRIAVVLPLDLASPLNLLQLVRLELLDLLHHRRRQGVNFLAGTHQHGLRHGQGKRQIDAKDRPALLSGSRLDASAEAGDLAAHHIQTHTAPGNLGHLLSGGKSRLENHVDQSLRKNVAVCRELADLDRMVANRFQIEAGPVITQGQHDFIAFLARLDADRPGLRLAGPNPVGRTFHAVGQGIAQQMFERCRHFFQHASVQFHLCRP